MNDYYLNKENYLDVLSVKMLDKDGDLLYTILFKDVIYKSLSEIRLQYYASEFNEQTFSVTFLYNYIDIIWELDDNDTTKGTSIFDIPIVEGDPRDVRGLIKEMKKRKFDSAARLGN